LRASSLIALSRFQASAGITGLPSANSGLDVARQSLGAVRFKAPRLGEPEA